MYILVKLEHLQPPPMEGCGDRSARRGQENETYQSEGHRNYRPDGHGRRHSWHAGGTPDEARHGQQFRENNPPGEHAGPPTPAQAAIVQPSMSRSSRNSDADSIAAPSVNRCSQADIAGQIRGHAAGRWSRRWSRPGFRCHRPILRHEEPGGTVVFSGLLAGQAAANRLNYIY
jgi:hypothetical protein